MLLQVTSGLFVINHTTGCLKKLVIFDYGILLSSDYCLGWQDYASALYIESNYAIHAVWFSAGITDKSIGYVWGNPCSNFLFAFWNIHLSAQQFEIDFQNTEMACYGVTAAQIFR